MFNRERTQFIENENSRLKTQIMSLNEENFKLRNLIKEQDRNDEDKIIFAKLVLKNGREFTVKCWKDKSFQYSLNFSDVRFLKFYNEYDKELLIRIDEIEYIEEE